MGVPQNSDEKYRFDWVTPLAVSKHNSKKIFLGGNRLFISEDAGVSWTASPDLSTQTNRDSLEIMGVLGIDTELSRNDGTSSYGEIISISESPLWDRVIWVGTDDGNVQVSKDAGKTWDEVGQNIQGLPSNSYVSRVLASKKGRPISYVTFEILRREYMSTC